MSGSPNPARFEFLDHPRPLAFAHRGGALEGEENTMAAFCNAVRLGYRYLETDVQASRDGVAVIFHDDTLERVMGVPGRVADLTWADLSRLRTTGGETLPRLDELLATWPEVRVNLDPKSDAAVEPMADIIRRANALPRVCVGSFDVRRTLRLRKILGEELCWSPSHGGVARMWLAGWGLPLGAPEFPAIQIPPAFRGLPLATPRLVSAAHAQGGQVHVWTVDDETEMERLLDIGVDGLMTDRPTLLKRVLERRGKWTSSG
jgi:glycerophosphoryl diester phosphodiesterase